MQPKDDATLETHPSPSKQLEMDTLRDRALLGLDWDQVLQEQFERTRERI